MSKLRTKYTEEEFRAAVKNCYSLRQVMLALDINPKGGGGYIHIRKWIKKLELDTSHFTGKGWSKNKVFGSKHPIKLKLVKLGLLEWKCYECQITEWNGKPLPLELDHIDGDHENNSFENLRILCPNCHSQTSTHCRGKEKAVDQLDVRNPAVLKPRSKTKTCNCGKLISQQATHCSECYHANNKGKLKPEQLKIQWPSKEELKTMVWEKPRSVLANELGVSDKAIAKHCNFLEIEQPPRGYWTKLK